MHNKLTLRTLFILLTGSVLVAALYRNVGRNATMTGLVMIVELLLFTFAIYGLMFALAYPLGRLNKYFVDQSDVGQSPFATDRLPQQIMPPSNSSNE